MYPENQTKGLKGKKSGSEDGSLSRPVLSANQWTVAFVLVVAVLAVVAVDDDIFCPFNESGWQVKDVLIDGGKNETRRNGNGENFWREKKSTGAKKKFAACFWIADKWKNYPTKNLIGTHSTEKITVDTSIENSTEYSFNKLGRYICQRYFTGGQYKCSSVLVTWFWEICFLINVLIPEKLFYLKNIMY